VKPREAGSGTLAGYAGRGGSYQTDHSDKIVGGGHQVANHLGLVQAEVTLPGSRAKAAKNALHPGEFLERCAAWVPAVAAAQGGVDDFAYVQVTV